MIYRFILFLLAVFSLQGVHGQNPNLVPNGSFEERVDCIYNNSDVEDAPPWFNPTAATPDIFHQCAVVNEAPCPWPEQYYLDPWFIGVPTNVVGCEEPYDGVGYAGFFVYGHNVNGYDGYKEYISVRLTEPLEADLNYTVKFYLSLAERMGFATWNVQVYFSPDSLTPMDTVPIFYDSYIDVDPQLSGTPGEFIDNYDGWHKMEWTYTATGNEKFMYIGNFQNDSEMNPIYVLEADPEENYSMFSYYYIDKIEVRKDTLSTLENIIKGTLKVRIYPNPLDENLSIHSEIPVKKVTIYDSQGRLVFERVNLAQGINNFRISKLSSGIYIARISANNGAVKNIKFVKR